MTAAPPERLQRAHLPQRIHQEPFLLPMHPQLVVRALQIRVRPHNPRGHHDLPSGRTLVQDLQPSNVPRQRTMHREMVPDCELASLGADDAVLGVARHDDGAHPAAGAREREEVVPALDVEHDRVEDLGRLATEHTARRTRARAQREPDERLDDAEEVQRERVLCGRELEVGRAQAGGEEGEEGTEGVKCAEGVGARVRGEVRVELCEGVAVRASPAWLQVAAACGLAGGAGHTGPGLGGTRLRRHRWTRLGVVVSRESG